MKKFFLLFVFVLLMIYPPFIAQESATEESLPPSPTLEPNLTPLPTETPLPIETATELPSATPLPTETPTETATVSPTQAEITAEVTELPSPEITAEVTAELTVEPSQTAAATATGASTATATNPQDPALLSYTEIVFYDAMTVFYTPWGMNADLQLIQREGVDWVATNNPDEMIEGWRGTGSNLAIEAEFVLPTGALSFHLRESASGTYRLDLDSSGNMSLWRGTSLVSSNLVSALGNLSHQIVFRTHQGQITVELDGNLALAFNDPQALPAGTANLSLHAATDFAFTEIKISMALAEYGSLQEAISNTLSWNSLETGQSEMALMQLGNGSPINYRNAILYTSNTPSSQIYLLDVDACQTALVDETTNFCTNDFSYALTNFDQSSARYVFYPRWSPDRSKIAFYYSGPENGYFGSLYVMSTPDDAINDIETSASRISNMANIYDIDWSPDGAQLVVAGRFNNVADIFLVDFPGCEFVIPHNPECDPENLTNSQSAYFERGAAWSPDGMHLVYVSNRNTDNANGENVLGGTELWIRNTAGTHQQLTQTGDELYLDNFDPDWSPDGSRIVYGRDYDDPNSNNFWSDIWIFTLNPDRNSGIPTQLIPTFNAYHKIASPTWSPGNNQIAFTLRDQISSDISAVTESIVIYDTASTALTRMTAPITRDWSPDWGLSNFQCAYAPIPTTTLDEIYNNPDYVTESEFSDGTFFRSEPNTGASIIGSFYGVKVNSSGQPVNQAGGLLTLTFDSYLDMASAGAVFRTSNTPPGQTPTAIYATHSRRLTPLYSYLTPDGYTWYLIDYNGSLAWVFGNLINIGHCGFIPSLPGADPRLNLNTYYNNTLPISQGAIGTAPNPELWTPFGECIQGLPLDSSREYCAYELYLETYNYFADPANATGDFELQDILMIVLMNEWGSTDLRFAEASNLTVPQRYILEAGTRNMAQVCAEARGVAPVYPITCNMKGISAFLIQVQSFYQATNLQEILRDGSQNYQHYVDEFSYITFSPLSPEAQAWASGSSGGPSQWGNYAPSNPNNVYNTASNYLNNPGTRPANVSASTDLRWVYVNPGTTPLISIYAYGVRIDNTGSCKSALSLLL